MANYISTLIDNIKNFYKDRQERKFFKKHRVNSWEEYNFHYDPDINRNATNLNELYHGYDTYIVIPNPRMVADIFGTVIYTSDVGSWCKENCNGKYRIDIIYLDYKTRDLYTDSITNTNAATDEFIVAFKEQQDAVYFIMNYVTDEMSPNTEKNVFRITKNNKGK